MHLSATYNKPRPAGNQSVTTTRQMVPFMNHLILELDSRFIKPSSLFTITNLLQRKVENWSPAMISATEILGACDRDISEIIRLL